MKGYPHFPKFQNWSLTIRCSLVSTLIFWCGILSLCKGCNQSILSPDDRIFREFLSLLFGFKVFKQASNTDPFIIMTVTKFTCPITVIQKKNPLSSMTYFSIYYDERERKIFYELRWKLKFNFDGTKL